MVFFAKILRDSARLRAPGERVRLSEKEDQKIRSIRVQIGLAIREAREARGETLEQVARRAGSDKGNLSHVESGEINPTLTKLLSIIVHGLEMDWANFCLYFNEKEASRMRDERKARRLLDDVLRRGPEDRRKFISAMETLLRGFDRT